MSYVLERDGLATCPDDPLRTAPPNDGMTAQEETALDALCQAYTGMARVNIKEALEQTESSATVVVGDVLTYCTSEKLAELIHEDMSYEQFRVILAGHYNREAGIKADELVNGWIDAIADRTGRKLAEVHIRNRRG